MQDQWEAGRRSGGTALREGWAPGGPREVRPARTLPRRGRAAGPCPVRPRVASAPVRPAEPARPQPGRGRAGERARPGQRVLLRTVPVLPARIRRRRRVAATIGMALLAAAVVVALGLLADVAAAARQSSGAPGVTGHSPTPVVTVPGPVAGVLGG
ncbi:hypothetical protein [Pseudonocardia hydrocarbonoxydans]|uniref:Uncharacterized protein n=1 Tax=Pseudonocardia hydrocarbonoxydans TaxID=76726 RepID=A0A4Y3WMG7_9PSEU|nr:hypothetical protein [Pseudonocardia hydrocarbonoxydans]GEC19668.1 hypothetical protein PHY01_19510 [Pseudonocardia hydrocarbonoxydans]